MTTPASQLRTGDAVLYVGTINDGEWLKRSGTSIVSGTPGIAVGSITGFAAGVATFLATPSSANLAAAVTDEAGTGSLLFDTDARISGGTQTIFNPAQVGGLLLSTAKLVTSGTAYFLYCGVAPYALTVATIESVLTGNAAGTVAAEVAVYTSTTAPTGSAVALTYVASTSTVTDMTSGSNKIVKGTVSAAIAKGTPFWIGFRAAYGTTQPTLVSAMRDDGRGYLASAAASAVLTDGLGRTATPIAFVAAATQQCPHFVAKTF